MIEPKSLQSHCFPMLAPLTTGPQQHMCMHDENQTLKSCVKVHYPSRCVCHKSHDIATSKLQVYNFMYRLIISPNFKFLALVVSEFMLDFKKSCFG